MGSTDQNNQAQFVGMQNEMSLTHRQVVTALIKELDIHQGIWQLSIEFVSRGVNVPMDDKSVNPGSLTIIKVIGLTKVDKESFIAVDAAKVNSLITRIH